MSSCVRKVLADAQNALTSASDDVAKAEAQIAIEVRTILFFSHCFSYDSFLLTVDLLTFFLIYLLFSLIAKMCYVA